MFYKTYLKTGITPSAVTAFNTAYNQVYNNIPTVQTNFNRNFQETITEWYNENTCSDSIKYVPTLTTNTVSDIFRMMNEFNTEHGNPDNFDSMYTTFRIPKASGGYRQITAPNDELKRIQRTIVDLLIEKVHILYHNSCYAYTKGRSCKDAVQIHQRFNSNWFYKFDMKDFFPSTTPEVVTNSLKKIYPFAVMDLDDNFYALLNKFAMYQGGLPQGTPLSPMLTNIIMTPVDYTLNTKFNMNTPHGRYTRYADDILVSFREKVAIQEVQTAINDTLCLYNLPYRINPEKTRCGSKAGSNWNLGVMLNKDNNITIGYKRKQKLRATVFSFLKDFTNGNAWSIIDTQTLIGELGYLKYIEPDYYNHMMEVIQQKTNCNFKTTIKTILH